MKKLGIIGLLSVSLLLAGCGKTGQDMTFNQAYSVLKSHNIFAERQYVTPDTTKVLSDTTNIDFTLNGAEGFSATGTIKSIGTYNLPSASGGVNMNLTIDSLAYEPSFGTNILVTGDIKFVEANKNIYGKIDNFVLSPEKDAGNVEGGVINALINTISRKRIQLSDGETPVSLVPYRKNITEFFHQLNVGWDKYSVFKEVGKTTIDGYTAYKLGRDETGIRSFVQHILQDAKNIGTPIAFDGTTLDAAIQGIIDSPLEGYLIIKEKDHVVLRIDSVTTKDSGILGFVYDKNGLQLTVKDTDNSIIASGNVQKDDKELVFLLDIPNNKVSIEGYTKNNQENIQVTIKNPEFVLGALIGGTSSSIDTFVPTIVTGSTPLQQIIQGFSILSQGMNETGTGQ